jgi:uncharacterized protein (TIGR02466 family)
MNYNYINIFPTTIYVGEIENHLNHKNNFYEIYPKYEYEQVNKKTNTINTVSENQGNPLIHLEKNLDSLFCEICNHTKNYLKNVLMLKDIFDIVITKSWLSRSQDVHHEIPLHVHSPSHISFVYYLNIPENSHSLQFSNKNDPNSIFSHIFTEDCDGDHLNMVKNYNEVNSQIFYLNPQEGNIVIFPSKLPHCTKSISENFVGERLSLVGDIILILKDEYLSFSHGFIHEKYWKKFT